MTGKDAITIRPAGRSDAADLAIIDNMASHGLSLAFWQRAVERGEAEDPLSFARERFADQNAVFGWSNALVAEEDGRIEIDITDEGPGLPPERLVDPFARFGAHETKAGPSAGLGLTFVKRAVELHNGTISVDSGPGVGTRFVIRIPQDHGPVESD